MIKVFKKNRCLIQLCTLYILSNLLMVINGFAAETIVDAGTGVGSSIFGRDNQMVLDASGNPVTAFVDSNFLYLLHCNDSACQGGDDIANTVFPTTINGNKFGLSLNVLGNPVMSFYESSTGDLLLLRCVDVSCLSPPEVYAIATVGDVGRKSALRLDANGFPVISFTDDSNKSLNLIHCDDAICAGGNDVINTVASFLNRVDTQSLILDNFGYPVIAFSGDSAARIAHCNDINCSGNDEPLQQLDTTGSAGIIKIQLDSAHYPVVAFSSSTSGVKLMHCNDINCDAAVNGAESLNVVSGVGGFFDFILDSGGRPMFASTSSGIILTHCNDVNCAGNDELTGTPSGFAVFEVSLQADISGNPLAVAFRSPGIRAFHCNDIFCLGGDEQQGVVNAFKVNVGQYGDFIRAGSQYLYSYYDFNNGNLRFRRCQSIPCAVTDTIVEIDNSTDVGLYTSLVIDASNNPLISYYDAVNKNLKIADCTQPNCSAVGSFAVDSGGVGEYNKLVLDASGNPVMSYFDANNGALKVVHCDVSSCASFSNSIQTVDTGVANTVGLFTDLVLDSNGYPVVSYYDSTAGVLKLAHCNDINCDALTNGAESIVVVDSIVGNDIGQFTSLKLDAMGNPVVSYYDATAGALKLAHCGDVNCNSGNSIETVDLGSGNNVGQYNQMELDASGFPIISYYDATAGNILLIHCNDVNCNGGNEAQLTVPSSDDVGQFTAMSVSGSTAYISTYNSTQKSRVMFDVTIPVSGPLLAPTNLIISGSSTAQIQMTWNDNASTETNYRVEVSTNGGMTFTEIANIALNSNSYIDTNVSNCFIYTYRVRAYRSGDAVFSNYSNTASTSVCNQPIAPSMPAAVSLSSSQISISWQDNSSTETGFNIQRSDNGINGWIDVTTTSANFTAYNDNNLICSQEYFYRIRAVRSTDGQNSGFTTPISGGTLGCVLNVDTTSDNPSLSACTSAPVDCSIRGALIFANSNNSAVINSNQIHDKIIIPMGLYTLTQLGAGENNAATGDLDVLEDVDINGVSSLDTLIDASGLSDRIFHVLSGKQLIITNLGLSGGSAVNNGGAVLNQGKLTINSLTISDNTSSNQGHAIYNDSGDLTINNSAIVNNFGTQAAITNTSGQFSANNATIMNNLCQQELSSISAASNNLTHMTMNHPQVIADDGSSLFVFQNNIFNGSCSGINASNITSNGGNLESPTNTCGLNVSSGDLVNVISAKLLPLSVSFGTTQTLVPYPDSLAVDLDATCPLSTDQRGISRPININCDAGAVEVRMQDNPFIFADGFE